METDESSIKVEVESSIKNEVPEEKEKKKDEIIGRKTKDRLEMARLKHTTENFDKKEAALKIVESRRLENQNKNADKPKTVVAPSNFPWTPNPHFILPPNSISALSIDDHRRYVAIIANYIRMDATTRFVYNNIELESMDSRLANEREKFIANVKEQYSDKGYYSAIFKGGVNFGLNRFKERLSQLSDAGYHSVVSEVPWKNNTCSIASANMYIRKPTVLSLGKSKKLDLPDPTRRCVFEVDADSLNERYPCSYSTKSIRDDSQAFDFANENNVTAILSSSAMKHLLTSSFPLRQYRRAFPVSVFRKFMDGGSQRVVSIGNPVPTSPPSKTDLMRTFAKYVVRNSMEKKEVKKEERIFKGVRPLKRPASKDVTEEKNEMEVKKAKVLDHVVPVVQEKVKVDVLDSIFDTMEESPNVFCAPVTSSPYSYMVVPIDKDGVHKVLVRSRPHGRDIANNRISVSAKLQYIPQCGAEEPFLEEKIWNALTALLQDSVYQTDIHLNIPEAHCLQITQSKSQKMFEVLSDEGKALLSGRWQRFYNLLEEIKSLEDGEYLLVENDNEMLEIWAEAIGTGDAIWTRKKLDDDCQLTKSEMIHNEPISFSSHFNGFAYHIPLVWHIVKGRIPASFLPPNPNKGYTTQQPQQQHRGGGGFRGNNRSRGGRGGGGNFRGGRGGRGGRGNFQRGGGASNRGKPVQYTDHDANPFNE